MLLMDIKPTFPIMPKGRLVVKMKVRKFVRDLIHLTEHFSQKDLWR
jgi:hypothetical protein